LSISNNVHIDRFEDPWMRITDIFGVSDGGHQLTNEE